MHPQKHCYRVQLRVSKHVRMRACCPKAYSNKHTWRCGGGPRALMCCRRTRRVTHRSPWTAGQTGPYTEGSEEKTDQSVSLVSHQHLQPLSHRRIAAIVLSPTRHYRCYSGRLFYPSTSTTMVQGSYIDLDFTFPHQETDIPAQNPELTHPPKHGSGISHCAKSSPHNTNNS